MKCIMLVLSVVLAAAGVAAQTQTGAADSWTVPRTSDGHPDLQGIWTAQTFTPLQRPDRLAGREFLTEEEAAELTELLTAQGVDPLARNLLGEESEAALRDRIPSGRPDPLRQRGLAGHAATQGVVEPENIADCGSAGWENPPLGESVPPAVESQRQR